MEEVLPILNHKVRNHIILIDDAREFTGKGGYPDIVELSQVVTQTMNIKKTDSAQYYETNKFFR